MSRSGRELASRRGPLAWMAQNSVAANVLMAILVIGGLMILFSGRIKQEVFPEVELDMVLVNVPYPGASPEEVEQGVILVVEEAVRGLDGVKEVRGTAREGVGVVAVELLLGADPDRALSDVKSAVDRIASFPEDIERPVVSLATNRQQVISLVFYGDQSEEVLRALADRARDELLQHPRITQIDLSGIRPLEISIEVSQENLRKYGLTLEGVAGAIRQASIDMPAGEVRTSGGEILLRTKQRRDRGTDFEDIVLLSQPDGSKVRVRDVATVRDGFRELDREAFFEGKRAVMLNVFRVGDETPIEVSDAVKEFAKLHRAELPPGVEIEVWADRSEIYRDRISLLLRNAYLGLALVLLTLGIFLEIRLAFWVTLGIPISFLGALFLMPTFDVSLNMISLFAFIVTLGMVVDDAIVVGEAVYMRRQEGMSFLDAAIAGVREVAAPVIFAILTSCLAFMPLLFVPGTMGKFFRVIPIVVILVLLLSLVESLLVLPAHLAHGKRASEKGIRGFIHHQQQRFSRAVERFIEAVYRPFLRKAIEWRYLTLAGGIAILIGCFGLVAGGRIQFTFFPKIDGDVVTATLEMPIGTPVDETRRMQERITLAAQELLDEAREGRPTISRGLFTDLGALNKIAGGPAEAQGSAGGHLATTMVYLVPSDQRPLSASEFARRWREKVGGIPGAEAVTFDFTTGGPASAPIDFEISHPNERTLERAAARVAEALEHYNGVIDIDPGFREGKEQLDFQLTAQGRALGLTESDLARQVRSAFFGAEAVRQQRGRDEVRVYVRLPESDRRTLQTIEQLVLRTPGGGEIPLGQAATIQRGRAYTEIKRTDARRTLNVTADIVPGVANANEVVASVQQTIVPELVRDYPGLNFGLGGQQQDQAESLRSLGIGFAFAMIAMFALLAVAFRSYVQPAVVMTAIPFGAVGAILGHALMGYDISLISMMGMVALSGVVVNDSLILIIAANEFRKPAGVSVEDGVVLGGLRRFRPIILTSLTTFFGLMPMILEPSVQARFLIPMAISLGFGVLFATGIILVLVPAIYVIVEDVQRGTVAFFRWIFGHERLSETSAAESPPASPGISAGE